MNKTTPLDQLIIYLAKQSFKNPSKLNHIHIILQAHLSIIRTLYLEMLSVDFITKITQMKMGTSSITIEEFALVNPMERNKVVIYYEHFIYILNQMGRVLKKHKFIVDYKEFPLYFRIRFYRNCVTEHWEEYIDLVKHPGFTFNKNKAPLPVIEQAKYGDKEKIVFELNKIFKENNRILNIPDKFKTNSMLGSSQEYSDFWYSELEKISPQLITRNNREEPIIKKEIVSLLFKLSFPLPICDVENYLETLANFLSNITNCASA